MPSMTTFILKRKIFDTTPDGTEKTDAEIQEEITARDKVQTDYEKKTRRRKEEMEAAMKKAEDDIAKYEADLDAITRNFEETLQSYEDVHADLHGRNRRVMGPVKPVQEARHCRR
jgi:chromosome segregation ATPase